MQDRGRCLANKMALVFITILVLELVLIGDQVEPLKAIKKKILKKKLKKLLPLLALAKLKMPLKKKKIILIPVSSRASLNDAQHPPPPHPVLGLYRWMGWSDPEGSDQTTNKRTNLTLCLNSPHSPPSITQFPFPMKEKP